MTNSPLKKSFPVISLALLVAAYSTLSWWLYQTTAPWAVWAFVSLFAVFQALLLTTLSDGLRLFIRKWLKSDIGYFSVVALGAFSITIILTWFHIFEYVLMILGAELLARLELQTAGVKQWQMLGLLTAMSFLGLGVGWLLSDLLATPLR